MAFISVWSIISFFFFFFPRDYFGRGVGGHLPSMTLVSGSFQESCRSTAVNSTDFLINKLSHPFNKWLGDVSAESYRDQLYCGLKILYCLHPQQYPRCLYSLQETLWSVGQFGDGCFRYDMRMGEKEESAYDIRSELYEMDL